MTEISAAAYLKIGFTVFLLCHLAAQWNFFPAVCPEALGVD